MPNTSAKALFFKNDWTGFPAKEQFRAMIESQKAQW